MSKEVDGHDVEMHQQHTYDFRANNQLGSRALFDLRKDYRDGALYDEAQLSFHEGTTDLLVDEGMTFFGRIDQDNVPRYLKFSHMKAFDPSVSGPGSDLTKQTYAANFVVDAFTDMVAELKKMIAVSHCGLQQGDISLEPKQGRVDSYAVAQAIFGSQTLPDFNYFATRPSEQSNGRSKLDKIRVFDDMVEVFLQFMGSKSGLCMPITHTGTILHPAGSIQMSGLAVLLKTDDQSRDTTKTMFLNDEFFDLYRRLAIKYGFLIDRNCPWRLIADIVSPQMKPYMDRYGLTQNNLFEECYIKAYDLDLALIKKQFTSMWNSFVTNYPKYSFRDRGCGSGLARRERLTAEELAEKYDDAYWLSVYVKMRDMEAQSGLSKISINRIQKHAAELAKALDTSSAMEYINRKFQRYFLDQRMAGRKFMPHSDSQEERQQIVVNPGGDSAISGY